MSRRKRLVTVVVLSVLVGGTIGYVHTPGEPVVVLEQNKEQRLVEYDAETSKKQEELKAAIRTEMAKLEAREVRPVVVQEVPRPSRWDPRNWGKKEWVAVLVITIATAVLVNNYLQRIKTDKGVEELLDMLEQHEVKELPIIPMPKKEGPVLVNKPRNEEKKKPRANKALEAKRKKIAAVKYWRDRVNRFRDDEQSHNFLKKFEKEINKDYPGALDKIIAQELQAEADEATSCLNANKVRLNRVVNRLSNYKADADFYQAKADGFTKRLKRKEHANKKESLLLVGEEKRISELEKRARVLYEKSVTDAQAEADRLRLQAEVENSPEYAKEREEEIKKYKALINEWEPKVKKAQDAADEAKAKIRTAKKEALLGITTKERKMKLPKDIVHRIVTEFDDPLADE